MHGLLKAIIWVLIIFAVVTLPAYIWSKLDRESYENFLLLIPKEPQQYFTTTLPESNSLNLNS